MSKEGRSVTIQAAILASAGLITKAIGFVYRIPMANILGNTGNGIYSVAFGIYSIALTLSSYSMPVSISKLIAEKSIEDKDAGKRVFRVALVISLLLGLIASMGLYFGADFLADQYHKDGIQMSLRILAPTTLIVSVLGCFRGYFQGYGNMLPTSVSQVLEQIVNAVISVVGALYLVKVVTDTDNLAAVRSAGGTTGTLAGALTALLIIFGIYWKNRDKNEIHIALDEFKSIAKALILMMLPIIFSQTIYQIGYTLDDLIFPKIMLQKGFASKTITDLQGIFNTQYTQMINLPIGMATAFGVSLIPRISRAFAEKNQEHLDEYINKLISMTSMIVFPAAVGLSVCSKEIMEVLFPALGSYTHVAVRLMLFGSYGAVFYSFSTISTSILQGTNHFRIPVINSFISLVLHIGLVILLLFQTDWNIYVILIGDLTFALLIFILNGIYIKKYIRCTIQLKENVLKHILNALIMGIAIVLVDFVCRRFISITIIAMAVKVLCGMIVYGILEFQCLKSIRRG
ncbi:MAG: polysaccharide biosynthesis protein [Eubacterium sp.]|nr:polysaccharide biosynthesis protein [Eubacterium sp.]